MRREFAEELHKQMTLDDTIVLITMDLGYGMFDQIQKDYPKRFYNVGASEQAGMDIAVGMALSGKKVFVYSITPFLIYRAFETIRTYIDHERIPIVMVGSGRNRDYIHDGYSHWCEDVSYIMKNLWNVLSVYPDSKEDIPMIMKEVLTNRVPYFINLKR
jgi:transketolase